MTTATVVVDQPGVYPDMPAAVYHADPVPGGSLSVSGAKLLLPPSCPAKFQHAVLHRYSALHGQKPKSHYDFGHAAHLEVLGIGTELAVFDYADWTTRKAQAARKEAYAEGRVPLLAAERQVTLDMAAKLREHPEAGRLLDPERGRAEHALFWTDTATGVMLRSQVDMITGRFLVDYKTAVSASPDSFSRSLYSYGYYIQAPWYLAGARALDVVGPDGAFLFVVQEKEAPYVVSVYQPDGLAMRAGREDGSRAVEIYRDCREVDVWPAYTTGVEQISLPYWIARRYEEW